ncbi:MAG TPA: sigma-54-dependent Fis family transcriptional regulator [Steroidobacteraceae bacterium]|nr:sigma-54-dependent Fis family transcriptional regulator [Steroidobacteraceae bacterium]
MHAIRPVGVAEPSRPPHSVRLLDRDLAPTIAASWQRSLQHGLRRADHALFNYSVSACASKRIAEANRTLHEHASVELERLYKSLGSARWVSLCVNQIGEIVCFTGDKSAAPRELKVLMHPGRRLSETDLGTTAPGCVLQERQPIVVSCGEHFLTELQHFFCAGAPLFGPEGDLVGALDITGVDVGVLPLAAEMVMMAARRIENAIVGELPACSLLRFHSDERLIGTLFEGIAAVDSGGRICGLNRTAWQLLGPCGSPAIGAAVDTLFGADLDGILRKVAQRRDAPVAIRVRSGAVAFLNAERGTRTAPALRRTTRDDPQAGSAGAPSFFAEDETLRRSYEKALRIVRSGLPIVVHGETGTGKELFVRSLQRSVRPNGPFLAINCAAIPEGLIESELFGYGDGAFTGSRKHGARGKIEQAHNGVLMLDEIGDMSLPLQSRLLRVLQERTVTRIGEASEVPIDIVVVCATHRDLAALVAEGKFREDLYYRLNGFTVDLPPLRERTDKRSLVMHLLERWSPPSLPARRPALTDGAFALLEEYAWPGNIRQLELVIRGMLALCDADRPWDVADLPDYVRDSRPVSLQDTKARAGDTRLSDAQSRVIRAALLEQHGNLSATARALGVSRGTLYTRIRKYGIEA